MRRVLLIGSGGSGKSTLAKHIGKCRDLPVVHLDSLYWKPGWVESSKEEWQEIIQELLSQDSWVMDGNFGGTLEMRLAVADMIIFLDLPPIVCLWRVIKRRIKFHNKSRPDMAKGCLERWDWKYIIWVWTYRQDRNPAILNMLHALASDKRVVILKSLASVRALEKEVYEAAA